MAAIHVLDPAISVLEIHDESLSCGVQAEISPRNNFVVYGVQRGSRKNGIHEAPQYVHEVTAKSALYNDFVRKLVNETHSLFLSLNTRVQGIKDERRKKEIAKISQQYRSVLLVCCDDLHKAELGGDVELSELSQMFTDIELLWHLIQALVIDSHSVCLVLYKLLDWLKWHFVSPEKKHMELILTDEPCEHPLYWDTIVEFLLQGKISPARSLLSMHRKSQREDFISLDELLRKMPMYSSSSGISVNEFRMRWRHWQEECKARLKKAEFSSNHNLETICKILCGDHETLSEKSNICGTWFHVMISVLLYTDPCIKISTLGDNARTYYNNVRSDSGGKSSLLHSIILAAMELDIPSVINLACSYNDGWWFAVHLMDLLCHGNLLENDAAWIEQYRSFLLMNYADTLMSHSSLWQVGMDYLDQCKGNRELLEIYLERIPIKTETEARKIIHLARKRNLDNLVRTVANVMTQRAMANGKLGTALTWVMHSKEVHFADEIAERWLKDYTQNRKMEGFEIFKNMGPCMLVSDKLTFIGKYCEFHKLYNDGELKSAASLLVSLLSSGLAPANFQLIMLIDALPLLESSELIFSSRDTTELMKCLEDTVVHSKNKPDSEDIKGQENTIRLSLVRNLTRSFIMETEDSDSEDEREH